MSRPLHRTVLPTGLAVALLAAGCGGEKALSKAEYVKQADQICQDSRAKQMKLGTPRSAKDIVALATKTKPLVRDEISKLRALKAPGDIKDTATATYDLLDKQVPLIDQLIAAAKANDLKRVSTVAAGAGKLNIQANAKAKQLGLKVCGGA